MMTGPVAGCLRLLAALDRLEIPYLVGGSAASSVYGIWRAAIGPEHADLLQAQFARRRHGTCSLFGGEPIEFAVATAERQQAFL